MLTPTDGFLLFGHQTSTSAERSGNCVMDLNWKTRNFYSGGDEKEIEREKVVCLSWFQFVPILPCKAFSTSCEGELPNNHDS
jgi:hypothetical protein